MQAMFGAGCFWGVEDAFRKLDIIDVAVGYSGGHKDAPTYEQVCHTDTGHVEVVSVEFDEDSVSYAQLLDCFFNCHNPTQINRQGPDVGTQYKSAIFTYNDEQAQMAQNTKQKLDNAGKFNAPIATLIAPAAKFWRAEEYHQQYFEKNNIQYCPSQL